MTSSPSIARLKVTLDEVEPAVVRRLEVPLALRLDRFTWSCRPRWAGPTVTLGVRTRNLGWGLPDPEWDRGSGPLDARKTTLLKVIEDTGAKTLTDLYDFGDGWEHTIKSSASHPAIRP